MKFRQIDQSPKHSFLSSKPVTNWRKACLNSPSKKSCRPQSFKAVGALSSLRLGWFSWETKKYEPSVILNEQVELVSLIGDVALKDGKPMVHAHAVIGKKDGTA